MKVFILIKKSSAEYMNASLGYYIIEKILKDFMKETG